MTPSSHLVLSALAAGVSLCAAICDLRTRRIPNRLIGAGLAAALGCLVVLNAPAGMTQLGSALMRSVLGLLFCSFWPVVLYAIKGLGGGDVKLFALAGVCLGPVVGLEAQAYAFTFGCIHALGYLIYERSLLEAVRLSGVALINPLLPSAKRRRLELQALSIPFGPAIALGIAVAAIVRGAP